MTKENYILEDINNVISSYEEEYIDEGMLKTIMKPLGLYAGLSASMLATGILSIASPILGSAGIIVIILLHFAFFGYTGKKILELIKFGNFADEVRDIQKALDDAPEETRQELKKIYKEAKKGLEKCRSAECREDKFKEFLKAIESSRNISSDTKRRITDNIDIMLGKSEEMVKKEKKNK